MFMYTVVLCYVCLHKINGKDDGNECGQGSGGSACVVTPIIIILSLHINHMCTLHAVSPRIAIYICTIKVMVQCFLSITTHAIQIIINTYVVAGQNCYAQDLTSLPRSPSTSAYN